MKRTLSFFLCITLIAVGMTGCRSGRRYDTAPPSYQSSYSDIDFESSHSNTDSSEMTVPDIQSPADNTALLGTIVSDGYKATAEGRFKISKSDMTFGRVGILGDSYSTYKGYIPQTNLSWYAPNGNYEENNVSKAEETWWKSLIDKTHSTLVLNDSWVGTTIGSIGYGGKDSAQSSFVTRTNQSFAGQKEYDTIFIFGGTADAWAGTPYGKLQYSDWKTDDFKKTLNSFCYILDTITQKNPKTRIIVLLNSDILSPTVCTGMLDACKHYDVDCILLGTLEKENGHPNAAGMKSIRDKIINRFK